MLKDKKYKKFMHCIAIDYSVGRKGIVLYNAQEFEKNVLKPNALKFIGVGTLFKHKLKVAHIYMHSNLIHILIFH